MATATLEPLQRLTKDLANAAIKLSRGEVRFLVDAYYIIQEDRKRSYNQERALGEAGEPHEIISWFADQNERLEKQVAKALDIYSAAHPVGMWMRDVDGIGPIIAAGLLAHIDINKAPTVGHIWRFAGLDPTSKWGKGEKRPHNAALKTLCWKLGESFVKVKGKETAQYGHVYHERRVLEGTKNENGDYAEQAKTILAARPTHAQAATYKLGKLPDGHLHMRAKRYAVKLFLSHLHEVWRKNEGLEVPLPYPIAHLGHVHKIEPKM